MSSYETIQGKGIGELLAALLADRTLVRFEVEPLSLNGLTVVRDIRKFWTKPYLLIDVPEGLWKSTIRLASLPIRFEFIGRDKLTYRFRTEGGKRARGNLWLRFPDCIERIQQRKCYRVEPEPTAKILFRFGETNGEMDVVNFSEGGALAVFHPIAREMENRSLPKPGGCLEGIKLAVPFEGRQHIVSVERARISRMTEDGTLQRIFYGLHFITLSEDENSRLNRLIAGIQREHLIKRRTSDSE
jgi:c-di-GMP-binding flagellar brake protein YcgR